MEGNVGAHALAAKRNAIVSRVLRWWDVHRRDLIWRAKPGETLDPYRVWLSEVLLQQTTAQAVAPFYRKFVEKWRAVGDLANAPHDEVIAAFAGLGYYSRARNLHACAKAIVAGGGRFPEEEAALRALPGVGSYTAAAVAAIAFGRPTLPIDGNIARILARLVGLAKPIAEARGTIAGAAGALAQDHRPGDFAQALMDIGAALCRPRNPICRECPLASDCAAFQSGQPEAYPRKAAAKPRPLRQGAVFFAGRRDGAFLARRRPPRGLLASTVELPGTDWTATGPPRPIESAAPAPAAWQELPGFVEQIFTHFALRLIVLSGDYDGPAPQTHFWVWPEAVGEAGFSNVMRKAVVRALECRSADRLARSAGEDDGTPESGGALTAPPPV